MTSQVVSKTEPGSVARLRVLVVDDSRAQRKILHALLGRWGYDVSEAPSGEEGLEMCRAAPFDIVVSDWMMPGMSGIELCRAFRGIERETYGYFILLTSKTESEEIARGFEVGADDFVSKPVHAGELRARLRAGERIVAMQRELTQKNRLLGGALSELQEIYGSLDRDLIEARKLQQSLVRERSKTFGSAKISLLLRPSGHVGGDLVGYFVLSARRIAFFAIDVSGHGVASAMMAARLAGMLSSSTVDGSVALALGSLGVIDSWPPEVVAARLNRLVLDVMQVDQYFTCVYVEADVVSGRAALVQAGHPHPLLLRADGRIEVIGSGGLPIGLVPNAEYERIEFRMFRGDRLFLMSDGFTESVSPDGVELGEDGVARFAREGFELNGDQFLDAMLWNTERFTATREFPDDLSAVLYEFNGDVG